jgi:hypothetical protein
MSGPRDGLNPRVAQELVECLQLQRAVLARSIDGSPLGLGQHASRRLDLRHN